MTARQLIEQALCPDVKTIQANIDYLTKLSSSLSQDDQNKIKAISDGMKQQIAVANTKKQVKQQPQQPAGNNPTTAQQKQIGDTAQATSNLETAQ